VASLSPTAPGTAAGLPYPWPSRRSTDSFIGSRGRLLLSLCSQFALAIAHGSAQGNSSAFPSRLDGSGSVLDLALLSYGLAPACSLRVLDALPDSDHVPFLLSILLPSPSPPQSVLCFSRRLCFDLPYPGVLSSPPLCSTLAVLSSVTDLGSLVPRLISTLQSATRLSLPPCRPDTVPSCALVVSCLHTGTLSLCPSGTLPAPVSRYCSRPLCIPPPVCTSSLGVCCRLGRSHSSFFFLRPVLLGFSVSSFGLTRRRPPLSGLLLLHPTSPPGRSTLPLRPPSSLPPVPQPLSSRPSPYPSQRSRLPWAACVVAVPLAVMASVLEHLLDPSLLPSSLLCCLYTCLRLPFPLSAWRVQSALSSEGDRTLPSSYRLLTILPVLTKLYSTYLLPHILRRLPPDICLHPAQNAFLPGHHSLDHAFTLYTLVLSSRAVRKPLYVVFLDLRAAYDSVSHPLLLQQLRALGLTQEEVDLVGKLYGSASARVSPAAGSSDLFRCVMAFCRETLVALSFSTTTWMTLLVPWPVLTLMPLPYGASSSPAPPR